MDLTLFLIMVIVGSIAGWIGMRISRSLMNRNSLNDTLSIDSGEEKPGKNE